MVNKEKKFYQKTRLERLDFLSQTEKISSESKQLFTDNTLLANDVADSLIENQITQFHLPQGVALNFTIDGIERVIPMVVEEPSVIAACSNAAKIVGSSGFKTSVISRELIGQIILKDVPSIDQAKKDIEEQSDILFDLAKQAHPSIHKRGGGLKSIETTIISDPQLTDKQFLTIYLKIETKDAMGANIINTILEGVTPFLVDLTKGTPLMSILSNYNTEALVSATCDIEVDRLATSSFTGQEIAEKIVEATLYSKLDPYRAATHNKGIMNGIDSVVIATGNDPRAVEAGAHAYASRSGRYQGMTDWQLVDNKLVGSLTLPMAVGTVGGAISVLPMAKANLELLNVSSSEELARIIICVGLAQNLAALKALVSDGIQKGHMSLHASSLAIQVGAKEEEIKELANLLRAESKMNTQIAHKLLEKIRKKS
ncbi:hydroxymethylglutaryl-CoA reductase, degradative [Vagococcus fluvialis]|uniref:hydroxymethylglutaryl-CoA reductase, degradative n=1 Tax=Vagococcus fluvialis TaxID=2738 RepID=UPI003B5A87B0